MIKNLLQEGFILKNKGHYKHAIEVFYKALEEDNSSTELLLEIAELYYRMQNLEKAGYKTRMTVHDEIVSSIKKGLGNVEEYEKIMAQTPAWATNCPVKAEGWRGIRYRK